MDKLKESLDNSADRLDSAEEFRFNSRDTMVSMGTNPRDRNRYYNKQNKKMDDSYLSSRGTS